MQILNYYVILLKLIEGCMSIMYYFFKILFIYFLERGEGREKERERNINVCLPLESPLLGTWPPTQACFLTGNRTSDPLLLSLVLNPLRHTSQGYMLIFKKRRRKEGRNGWKNSFLEEGPLELDSEGGLDTHVLAWRGRQAGGGNFLNTGKEARNPGHG